MTGARLLTVVVIGGGASSEHSVSLASAAAIAAELDRSRYEVIELVIRPDGVPPVIAATSDLAVVRMHGHSEHWDAKTVQERFDYRYSDEELKTWAGNVRRLAEDADETHVVFNNCYRDYAQVNAQQLEALFAA